MYSRKCQLIHHCVDHEGCRVLFHGKMNPDELVTHWSIWQQHQYFAFYATVKIVQIMFLQGLILREKFEFWKSFAGSVYLFLVSSRIRETRNEKFIFREISRLVFSKISRCIKEVKLEKSSIFKQLSFFRVFGVTIFGVSRCKMFHIFFFENSFTFYIFMPKNVRFTWNFEKRDETRNRHEKREVQNCREPGKFSSRDETRDKH